MVIIYFAIFAFIFFLSSLKQINQYERGVKFTMGKYTGIMEQVGVLFGRFFKVLKS